MDVSIDRPFRVFCYLQFHEKEAANNANFSCPKIKNVDKIKTLKRVLMRFYFKKTLTFFTQHIQQIYTLSRLFPYFIC